MASNTDIAISKFCFNGASLYVFLRVNIESDHDTIVTKWEVRNILLEKLFKEPRTKQTLACITRQDRVVGREQLYRTCWDECSLLTELHRPNGNERKTLAVLFIFF